MAVDITWFGLVNQYLETGDISELEAKIRSGGVPERFGNEIADLLTGKSKPLSPHKRHGLKLAKDIVSALNSRDFWKKLVDNPPLEASAIDIEALKREVHSMTNQRIANRFFPNQSSNDDAKRTMNKARQKYKKRYNMR